MIDENILQAVGELGKRLRGVKPGEDLDQVGGGRADDLTVTALPKFNPLDGIRPSYDGQQAALPAGMPGNWAIRPPSGIVNSAAPSTFKPDFFSTTNDRSSPPTPPRFALPPGANLPNPPEATIPTKYAPELDDVSDNRLAILPPELAPAKPNTDRRGVDVPALPGDRDQTPHPYTPEGAARYDFLMSRIPLRTEQRTMSDGTSYEAQIARKPTAGERIKAGLKTAGLAALQSLATAPPNANWRTMVGRAAGGGASGLAAGAASPKMGAEFAFNTFRLPQILQEEQRQRQLQGYADEDAKTALDREYRRAQIDQEKAATATQNAHRGVFENQAKDIYRSFGGRGTYNTQTGQFGDVLPDKAANPPRPLIVPPGRVVIDPQTQKKLYETPPAPPQPRTGNGRFTTPKAVQPPARAYQQLERVEGLRRTAESAWDRVKAASPEDRGVAERRARAAQDQYNGAVKSFGSIYGQHFETGIGESGWAYVKPRQQAQASTPSGSGSGDQRVFPMSALKDFAAEHGMDEAGARKMIESSGYTIR